MSRYLAVLNRRGALLAFAAATVARLPISMSVLGAVLLVEEVRDSYALAGAVTACFALATALGTPFWGRRLDRLGQARVLAPIGLTSSVLLVLFAVSTVQGAPTWVLAALAAGSGLFFPPVSPAMRAAWQALLPEEEDRQAAYALEAVAIELVFILGPLLLSLLLATTAPEVPLIVTGALLAAGVLVYVSSSASRGATAETLVRSEPAAPGTPRPARLGGRPVLVVLFVGFALSTGFGNLDVSVAATAREIFGNQSLLGFLYLGIAGGSAIGGLWYGARTWRGPEWRRLPVPLSCLVVGLLGAAGFVGWLDRAGVAASAPVVLLTIVVLLATGLFIAPSLIIMQNLVDTHSAAGRRGEAQSWLNAALTAGGAAGTAVAGLLIDVGGAPLSFAGASLALVAAALAARFGPPQSVRAAAAA